MRQNRRRIYTYMELKRAMALIQEGSSWEKSNWADIGAGTGLFTGALLALLPPGSKVYAVDKSPISLYNFQRESGLQFEIVEGDFTRTLPLPVMDGILMANALHFAIDHASALHQVLACLRPGGTFILVEYEQNKPMPPWVPYPIGFADFKQLGVRLGLSSPQEIGRTPSAYGHRYIYAAKALKIV